MCPSLPLWQHYIPIQHMRDSILITGASGFIGSFLVEEALRHGLETYAAVRQTSSLENLPHNDKLHIINLDLQSPQQLSEELAARQFKYIIHAAGVTKSASPEAFYTVNTDGTRNLCWAAAATQRSLKRFLLLSSLSVMGAIKEEYPHRPITIKDTPEPNTHYARSKLQAEEALREELKSLPWVILRPTGVYGPREKDYLMMARSIRNHVNFSVGYRPQHITFIYVKDLARAAMLALTEPVEGQTLLLSDGETYRSNDFAHLIRQQLGNKWCINIKAPLLILRAACAISEWIARTTGKITALNNDKYHILRQRNWMCDIQPARQQLGFEAQYTLSEGVEETIKWYLENKWL